MRENLMLIGEIAEIFGVSRKAMRIYEQKGIIKPVEVDTQSGYRYYSVEQVQQLNALLELKSLGFSLDEIKEVIDGNTSKENLLKILDLKKQAWQETVMMAKYKAECLEEIISNVQSMSSAEKITEMTDEERAWLLVKMVCIENVRTQKVISEALWL